MAPPFTAPIRFSSSTTATATHNIQHGDSLKMHLQQHQQQQQQQQQHPHAQSALRILKTSTRLVKIAYDLILINLLLPLLSLIYFKHSSSPLLIGATVSHHASIHHHHHQTASNSSSFSTLVGQLFFGYLGNAYGGHKFYSVDLMIIIFGTLFCAFSGGSDSGSDVFGGGSVNGGGGGGGGAAVIQYLTFWRFVLTLGIGGDYPISATVSSEEAAVTSRRRRGGGQLVAMLTSIQGLGNVLTSIVTLIVLIRFRVMIVDGEDDDAENMDMVWRICIAVGCLPALSTILIRYTMPANVSAHVSRLNEDTQNRFDGDDVGVFPLNDLPENEQDMGDKARSCLSSPKQPSSTLLPPPSSLSKTSQRRGHTRVFRDYCSQWENLKVLIGTSLSWFLLDIAFRSISLNQSYLLEALDATDSSPYNFQDSNKNSNNSNFSNKTTLYRHLWMTTLGNLTVSLLGIVPGYWFSIFSIEKLNRQRTQFLGFGMVTLFFILLSTVFHPLKVIVPLFITTFTLSQFFANLSPSTPFVVPGEVFPTRVRATAHGISAGSGKMGAVLATLMFNRLVETERPLGDSFFVFSSISSSFMRIPVGMMLVLAVMACGFLAVVVFAFPRGDRRLRTSKLVWPHSRNSRSNSNGGSKSHSRSASSSTTSRVHCSLEMAV